MKKRRVSARERKPRKAKGVVFVELIPHNANGKVLKRELRKQFPGPAIE